MSNILKRSIALMVIILLATACTTTPSLQAPTQVPANTNPPGSGDRNAPDGAPWFEVDRSGMGQSIDQG